MSTQTQGGYGYSEPVSKQSTMKFGLNAGNVRLIKFEFTKNGGKDGAEQDAMDITFTVDGQEKSYKKFPVTRTTIKDEATGQDVQIEDQSHPAIQAQQQLLSQVLTHIVGCFVEKETIKAALNTPISGFEEFCAILQKLLPNNFAEVALDAFAVWQWQIGGEAKNTYLEFPKNMKHGRWLQKSVDAVGEWEEQKNPAAALNEVALRYVDTEGNQHPFKRNGWFMNSNFSRQQVEQSGQAGQQMNQGAGNTTSPTGGAAKPQGGGW